MTRTIAVIAALVMAFISSGTTHAADVGVITGILQYPGEEMPAMRVYAFAEDGMSYYVVPTKDKQQRFTIANVRAGKYYVMAYPTEAAGAPSAAGGWSAFVSCGMNVQCADHSLLPVTVVAGKTTSGIRIADWYAPIDAFPSEPTKTARESRLVNECTSNVHQQIRDACNLRGYQAADARLTEQYQRTLATLDKLPTCKERLIQDQQIWLQYRSDQCAMPEGVGYKGYVSECLRGTTEQRLAYMREQTPDSCGH